MTTVMARQVTARSLYNDLNHKNTIGCDPDLAGPVAELIKGFGTYKREGKTKWRKDPIEVIDSVMDRIEVLLWDSGEITHEETDTRQRVLTEIVKIKKTVLAIISSQGG
jgi:hypothetical protein